MYYIGFTHPLHPYIAFIYVTTTTEGARIVCMEDYVQIVEEMLERSEKITLQEVRRVAGKGSYSTISEAIKQVLNRTRAREPDGAQ
jgi:hypothetical protein